MKTALVLLSGGMDSAAALWWARERWRVLSVSFRTPSTPAGELRAARTLSRLAGAAGHEEVPLPFLRWTGRGKPAGYLPQRNLVFLAAAAVVAERGGADRLVAGQLATDAESFPDAEPAYLRRVAALCGLRLELPFASKTKADVVRYGRSRGLPFERTWSCYRNGKKPCGNCVSCVERKEALCPTSPKTRRR